MIGKKYPNRKRPGTAGKNHWNWKGGISSLYKAKHE